MGVQFTAPALVPYATSLGMTDGQTSFVISAREIGMLVSNYFMPRLGACVRACVRAFIRFSFILLFRLFLFRSSAKQLEKLTLRPPLPSPPLPSLLLSLKPTKRWKSTTTIPTKNLISKRSPKARGRIIPHHKNNNNNNNNNNLKPKLRRERNQLHHRHQPSRSHPLLEVEEEPRKKRQSQKLKQ
jgi:hypothetical protein